MGKSIPAHFTLVLKVLFDKANATPPGGVAWPYFLVLLLIPIAVYRLAIRLSVAICYGFASGIFFAWPVFVDGRTGLRAEYGLESQAELITKIILFAVAMATVCVFSYGLALWQKARRRRCS